MTSPDRIARLRALTSAAIEEFGVQCFWNVRTDLDPIPQAQIAARQLSKYGGMRGLRVAAEIEQELQAIGVAPWR